MRGEEIERYSSPERLRVRITHTVTADFKSHMRTVTEGEKLWFSERAAVHLILCGAAVDITNEAITETAPAEPASAA